MIARSTVPIAALLFTLPSLFPCEVGAEGFPSVGVVNKNILATYYDTYSFYDNDDLIYEEGFQSLTPYKAEFVSTVNYIMTSPFAGSDKFDHVGASFIGFLQASTPNVVSFCLGFGSDDGATMSIDGKLVIDGRSPRNLDTVCGKYYMTGLHEIKVEYQKCCKEFDGETSYLFLGWDNNPSHSLKFVEPEDWLENTLSLPETSPFEEGHVFASYKKIQDKRQRIPFPLYEDLFWNAESEYVQTMDFPITPLQTKYAEEKGYFAMEFEGYLYHTKKNKGENSTAPIFCLESDGDANLYVFMRFFPLISISKSSLIKKRCTTHFDSYENTGTRDYMIIRVDAINDEGRIPYINVQWKPTPQSEMRNITAEDFSRGRRSEMREPVKGNCLPFARVCTYDRDSCCDGFNCEGSSSYAICERDLGEDNCVNLNETCDGLHTCCSGLVCDDYYTVCKERKTYWGLLGLLSLVVLPIGGGIYFYRKRQNQFQGNKIPSQDSAVEFPISQDMKESDITNTTGSGTTYSTIDATMNSTTTATNDPEMSLGIINEPDVPVSGDDDIERNEAKQKSVSTIEESTTTAHIAPNLTVSTDETPAIPTISIKGISLTVGNLNELNVPHGALDDGIDHENQTFIGNEEDTLHDEVADEINDLLVHSEPEIQLDKEESDI